MEHDFRVASGRGGGSGGHRKGLFSRNDFMLDARLRRRPACHLGLCRHAHNFSGVRVSDALGTLIPVRSYRAPALAVGLMIACSAATAAKQYGPGVTDTEIKIGQTMPY